MERLTRRMCGGWGVITGCELNTVSGMKAVVDRLAAYEDTGLEPEEIIDLQRAWDMYGGEIGITEILLENQELKEKRTPKCYSADVDGGCRYMVSDGDDEPIDRCKRCPLCYVDKQRHRAEPNDTLTLEELREMDGEPVYVVSSIGEHPMWYIVDVEEHELKNPWDRITLEEWDNGYPYRAYRRKPEEGTT